MFAGGQGLGHYRSLDGDGKGDVDRVDVVACEESCEVGKEFRRRLAGRRVRTGFVTSGSGQRMPVLGKGTGGRFGTAEDGGKFKALLQVGQGGEVCVTGIDAGPDHGQPHTARRGGLRTSSERLRRCV